MLRADERVEKSGMLLPNLLQVLAMFQGSVGSVSLVYRVPLTFFSGKRESGKAANDSASFHDQARGLD